MAFSRASASFGFPKETPRTFAAARACRVPQLNCPASSAQGRVGGVPALPRTLAPELAILIVDAYITEMNKAPSPEKAARSERQRLAAEDGSKALQEVLDAAIAVRANMARLRALRLAKEADAVIEPDRSRDPQPTAPRRSKRGGRN